MERLEGQTLLELLALGYVPDVYHYAFYRRIFQQVGADGLNVTPGAVGVPETVLDGVSVRLRVLQCPLGLLQESRYIFRVNVIEYVGAHGFLGVVAEDLLEGGARVPQGAVGVGDLDDLRGVLHQRAEAALALFLCFAPGISPGNPGVQPPAVGRPEKGEYEDE